MLLSDRLQGCEALKGLSDVEDHEHTEFVPIVENSRDRVALAHVVQNVLLENKTVRGIYIRRHGLYAWGETVAEVRRTIEIYEFLFEVIGRNFPILTSIANRS